MVTVKDSKIQASRFRGEDKPDFMVTSKVDARLPGKGSSNSHGARQVHLMITMIKWIRTSRLSMSTSLAVKRPAPKCTASGKMLLKSVGNTNF